MYLKLLFLGYVLLIYVQKCYFRDMLCTHIFQKRKLYLAFIITAKTQDLDKRKKVKKDLLFQKKIVYCSWWKGGVGYNYDPSFFIDDISK